MRKLSIEYDPIKCIGAKKCVNIATDYFKFDGDKAVLECSSLVNGLHFLAVEASPQQVFNIKKAGESCPVNAIRVFDEHEELVSTKVKEEGMEMIQATYDDSKEFILDPAGYFLIRTDTNNRIIEVGFCNSRNKVILKVVGKKPIDIYQTIINKIRLNIRKDHCAYLGRELQKAYIALHKGVPYVQDDELEF